MAVVERLRSEDIDPVSQTVPGDVLGRYVGHQVSVRYVNDRVQMGVLAAVTCDGVRLVTWGGHLQEFAAVTSVVHNVASCSDDGCRAAHAAAIEAAQAATLEVLAAREEELRAPAVGF